MQCNIVLQEAGIFTYPASNWDNPAYDAALLLQQITEQRDSAFTRLLEPWIDAYAKADGSQGVACAPLTLCVGVVS